MGHTRPCYKGLVVLGETMLEKIKIFLNHERYQAIAIGLVLILLAVMFGCQSKVSSIINPTLQVSRDELQLELNQLLSTAEIKFSQLDQQDQLKATLYQIGLVTAQTGTFNPIGLITAIAGILGVGATVDNVRKRKTIKTLESK